MHDHADTESQDGVFFRGDPGASMVIILFGILVFALGPLAFVLDDTRGFRAYVAVAGGLFGGSWIICRGILNLRRGRDILLSIGPFGIVDRRISNAPIPWNAITNISAYWRRDGANPAPPDIRALLLHLDPDFASRLRDNAFSRLARMLDKLVGITGVRIGIRGVSAKPYQVVQALDRYFPRWRQDVKT